MTREECVTAILTAAARLSAMKRSYGVLAELSWRVGKEQGRVRKLGQKISMYERTLVELVESVANEFIERSA